MNLRDSQRRRVLMCSLVFCSFMLFVSFYYKCRRKSSDPQNGSFVSEIGEPSKRVKRSKLKAIFKYSKVCATKKCRQFGNLFKRIINESVDPCDDFYDFVCGKFQRNDEIRADLTTLSNADIVVQQILREDLSGPTHQNDPKSVRYAINMFKACIDSKTIEERGIEPLIRALNSIGGWPLIGNKSKFDNKKYNALDSLAKSIAFFGLSAIIDVQIAPDFRDNTQNELYLSPSPNVLLRENIFESIQRGKRRAPNPSAPFKRKFKTLSERLDTTDEQTLLPIYDIILQFVITMGGKNDSDTRQQIIELVHFSNKLTEIQQIPQNTLLFNKITFKELNRLSSNRINFLQFVNKIYSLIHSEYKFKQDDICLVPDLYYFRQLPELLRKTPNRVIANFLGFKIVLWFGEYLLLALRDLTFEEEITPWVLCLDLIKQNMPFALSRKYVDKHFSQNKKLEASEFCDYIQDTFYEILQRNTLLDEFSRRQSLNKLGAIKKNVGYPDWLLDDSILDAQYDLKKECSSTKFFECLVYLIKRQIYIIFVSIDKPVNSSVASWVSDLTLINAGYMPSFNSITIPAAIINAFFASDNPAQLNYGRLGNAIGHELTHAFGTDGSLFDERGNLNPIWDINTQYNFDQREQCFVRQYNKLCGFGFCVNGENTVDENIADNGGILEAYGAYQIYNQNKGQPIRLPFVSQYTADQIFFISFATVWCDNLSPDQTRTLYENDEHSPNKYRVNAVLANVRSFANTFNCPTNSHMNPINKCILW